MDFDIHSALPQWNDFEAAAREHDEDARALLNGYIRECLEAWAELDLHAEIARDVQVTGYQEDDAVELVRRIRAERRGQGAVS